MGNIADAQPAVAFLLDFGYHSLEGGAATDGGECLGDDAIGDALKALLYKRFTLERKEQGFTHSHVLHSYTHVI